MKTNKYTSWQIQNEMLKVMALEVLRDVPASLHSSPFYSIMAAETTHPIGSRLFRWVDNTLHAHEGRASAHESPVNKSKRTGL